jgi:hypothetical protein
VRVVLAAESGGIPLEMPQPPAPIAGTWGEFGFTSGDANLVFTEGQLALVLNGHGWLRDESLWDMLRGAGDAVQLELAGGGRLSAKFSGSVGQRGSVDVEKQIAVHTTNIDLHGWAWHPPDALSFWVGVPDDARVDDSNLVIESRYRTSSKHLLVRGKYDLYFIQQDEGRLVLVVDTHGEELSHATLGIDFRAAEFALGCEMRLPYLVAVDESGTVRGAAGIEFGYRTAPRHRCPVSNWRDLGMAAGELVPEHRWVAVMAELVGAQLHGDDAGALNIATTAYLDSLMGHIHSNYLLAQVALEAFSGAILERIRGVLVKTPAEWLKWVDAHAAAIGAHAVDDAAAATLVNKVKSAQHAPSGDKVELALAQLGIEVPPAVIREVRRRSYSAHQFVMADEGTTPIQDMADRLALVQTVLVAVIAKHVGYEGPIVGWEMANGRFTVPVWWPWKRLPAARRQYLISEDGIELDPPSVD